VKIIKVKLKQNPYNIYIDHNIIKKIPLYLKDLKLGNLGIIITSDKIYSLYKNLIDKTFKKDSFKIVKVIDGERAKSKKYLFEIIEEIVKADTWNKKVYVVCLGGGTIGDLGGFAASIYKRGIPYVQIPTTLLSQIDASIGGKTAIDLVQAKNILGTIYQPKAVFIDPNFLKTLSKNELKEGLAEVIKYGVIKDAPFFDFLRQNKSDVFALKPQCISKLISVCVGIKAEVVAADEDEKKGIRTILNFGHTLAHAMETSLKYRKLSHGQAVSIGMVYAACLSHLLGKCSKDDVEKIQDIIRIFSLPATIKVDCANICKAMAYDKKFVSGKVRMVLLRKIGKVEVVEGISLKNIEKILKIFGSIN
jgi:3-dehydroquinate synthase